MPHTPQFPQMQFAAQGAVLLCSTASQVAAWDVATQQRRYACAGRLIGVSQSGATFATERGHDSYGIYRSATGEPQPITEGVIADLPFDVRYRVRLEKAANGRYAGAWVDITGERPHSPIAIQAARASRVEQLDNWAVIAPQQWIACAWSWEEGALDGAYGRYHAPRGNLPEQVSLRVSRFHQVPPLYYSREHDWLITGEQTAFNVYAASTGRPYGAGTFYRLGGGGDVIAFHPRKRFWLAVNRAPVLRKDAERQGFALLDIETSADTANEIQIFPEAHPVVALAFHPSGQWVACLLRDGSTHLWETATGRKVWSIAQA